MSASDAIQRKGYRFNGATAFQPWKCQRVMPYSAQRLSLQWGHGLSAVEIGELQGSTIEVPGASMGPPPFSRGNHMAGGRYSGGNGASMGPRPFSRGNARGAAQHSSGTGRFNGATAFQPWKCRPYMVANLRLSRFNGATAFQPWKLPEGQGPGVGSLLASMGPRPFSRGNCGCSPDAGRHGDASMGPRPFSRGNGEGYEGEGEGGGASMGPRPFSRGNRVLLGRAEGAGVASMGPRPFSRGNWPVSVRAGGQLKLQWGHGLSAVEIGQTLTYVAAG